PVPHPDASAPHSCSAASFVVVRQALRPPHAGTGRARHLAAVPPLPDGPRAAPADPGDDAEPDSGARDPILPTIAPDPDAPPGMPAPEAEPPAAPDPIFAAGGSRRPWRIVAPARAS
ncbi:hypothetical protein NWP09_06155, partial [Agrococcus sp. HG114]|nr:hypothetical protein [Agrococcus sp. HG114]